MKISRLAALVCVALSVSVCGCTQKEILKTLDDVHQDCVRHYTFAVGQLGGNLAGTLDCQPAGTTVTTTFSKPPSAPPGGPPPFNP